MKEMIGKKNKFAPARLISIDRIKIKRGNSGRRLIKKEQFRVSEQITNNGLK